MQPNVPKVLIVEPNPVVAADVAQTVSEALGQCQLVSAEGLATASEILARGSGIALAVLCMSPAAITRNGFDTELRARGMAVVVVSDEIDRDMVSRSWPRWGFATTPFTTRSLLAAITSAVRACTPPSGTCTLPDG